jgi:hypothetical protein
MAAIDPARVETEAASQGRAVAGISMSAISSMRL